MTELDDSTMQSGPNVLGALIFFSYIVAALVFTTLIIIDIRALSSQDIDLDRRAKSRSVGVALSTKEKAKSIKVSKQKAKRTGWIYFPVAASASFAVLSWNMLMFLVDSYAAWTTERGLPLVYTVRSMSGVSMLLQQIWAWSTHSTLFKTFAEHLLSTPATWQRARLVLLYSYALNMWMSLIGHQREVPNLWHYFIIDQILPVSFGQNLFCTALSLTPQHSRKPRQVEPAALAKFISVICYIGLLYVVPYTIYRPLFLPIILLLRLLLFVPYLIDKYSPYTESKKQHSRQNPRNVVLVCTCLLILVGFVDTIFGFGARINNRQITGINYAFNALSQDLWLAVLSLILVYQLRDI